VIGIFSYRRQAKIARDAGSERPRVSRLFIQATCWFDRTFDAKVVAMKPRISVITLGVADLERSLAFYRDGLGFPTQGIVGREFEHGAVAFFDLRAGSSSRCGRRPTLLTTLACPKRR
jgi:hypothetical protein